MKHTASLQPITVDSIKNRIHEIRGQRVMLDRDLAELYHVETKVLNQAVKRNLQRFPLDAMFTLSHEEFECLRSQNVTSNKRGGTRYLPYAFTELGIAMLSSVLSSEIAIQVNINIMRAFVEMRHSISQITNNEFRIEKMELNNGNGRGKGETGDELIRIEFPAQEIHKKRRPHSDAVKGAEHLIHNIEPVLHKAPERDVGNDYRAEEHPQD